MTLQRFIQSYRIATGGNYNFRLEEARLFIEDALEATSAALLVLRLNAATLYDVSAEDL